MDFVDIKTRPLRKGETEIYPEFLVKKSSDLMIKGKSFYAVWNDAENLWSTDEYLVQTLVDRELFKFAEENSFVGQTVRVSTLSNFGNGQWAKFKKYTQSLSDNSKLLDSEIVFANQTTNKQTLASRKLSYDLTTAEPTAWNELVETLYGDEREKIEWAIGAIFSGDAKTIQKFIVLYGSAGTGKSTILNIIHLIFEDYCAMFDAKALGSNNNSFATDVFRNNPLVAIQHDGDLSKIEDNTKINSIVSHEYMTMNEKYKPTYTARVNAFLFMGTNNPVKISNAKSGLIRRIIDVKPTGNTIPSERYNVLMERVKFELGGIANHCIKVFKSLGRHAYDSYKPIDMMFHTDVFLNFVDYNADIFESEPYITLQRAYTLYKEYCSETGVGNILPLYKIREELRNYFDRFDERLNVNGERLRSVYSGFRRFKQEHDNDDEWLVFSERKSILDDVLNECKAQMSVNGKPTKKWSDVTTLLSDIDTSEEHYVKPPANMIVIDFDIEKNGVKSLDENIRAASEWPPTYAEVSRSGNGVHLHYFYNADVGVLSGRHSDGVEVKKFAGNASLRRKRIRNNGLEIAEISSGLRKKDTMIDRTRLKTEKSMRDLIARNLRKEIHPATKPSVDFIRKITDNAYASGMKYDISDMRSRILTFAAGSTHQSTEAINVAMGIRYKSDEPSKDEVLENDAPMVFFDCEVFSNVFILCWKYEDSRDVVSMINPTSAEVEALFKYRLVGFNNRSYDNHILYARYLGYTNEMLYKLSKSLISGGASKFGEAYNVSYADVYDFSSKKQSLKRWQLDLGCTHIESPFPWDEPLNEDDWGRVVSYCTNDVLTTQIVFEHCSSDFAARVVLSELSGLTVNASTRQHVAKIIFRDEQNPESHLVYTDLSEMFPGYVYSMGVSTYRGEVVGEGGYVHAEPGYYENVMVLDVASMHPSSIIELNLFGKYTKNYQDLKDARVAIKHRDFETLGKLLGGRLRPYADEEKAEALSSALKLVLNSVYGYTAARFPNPFLSPRNKDNIVAKRGALFMVNLKHLLIDKNVNPIHIKTDSVKIVDPSPETISFVTGYGKEYGYNFELENTYKRFCLVNDAVYVALTDHGWEAVGDQFKRKYVFKTLFTEESLTLEDYEEIKTVTKGAMWLYMPNGAKLFIGRSGIFACVKDGTPGAGSLMRVVDDKSYNVSGTKGYLWAPSSVISDIEMINTEYYELAAEKAKDTINKFIDFEYLTRKD